MVVGTWNLENLFRPAVDGGPADDAAYEAKLDSLAGVITGLAPDVLAVQEVGQPEALEDLKARLDGRWHTETSAFPDARGIRVGFLSRLALADVRQLRRFPVWEATRDCGPPEPSEPELGRMDDVTYLYGECPQFAGEEAEVEGGCLPPIQVQSSPVCQKHAKLYFNDLMGQYPFEETTFKGAPAAIFDGGTRIEIYTTDTTITVYGVDPQQTRRVAELVRPALPVDIPAAYTDTLYALSDASQAVPSPMVLPPAVPATLERRDPC